MTQQEKNKRIIAQLRLMDDDFMSLVFDNNIEAAALLLNIILNRSDMQVIEATAQKEYKSISGRSITLDIYAKDSAGKVYDIEVQRADDGANPKRARFHSSMLDTRLLKKNDKFKDIADTYVIFITENDVHKKGLPLYHIERKITETDELFDDGAHIIYVNGEYRGKNEPVGRLMHDFCCTDPSDMNYPTLAEKVHYFKNTQGGQEIMCKIFEDLKNEATLAERKNIARSLLKIGQMSEDAIAVVTSLSIEEIHALAKEKSA